MITIKLPITLSEEDKKKVLEIQKQQSSVIRAAHSMLSRKDMKQKDIRKEFKKYKLGSFMDSWFVQSGTYKGMELFENDKSKKVKQKRIFGGKKNLKDYINKKITKDEYKARKLSKITSIEKIQFLEKCNFSLIGVLIALLFFFKNKSKE